MHSPRKSMMAASALVLLATRVLAGQPATARDSRSLPGRVVEVTAAEFFFRAPDTIPSGLTTFHLVQAGLIVDRIREGAKGQALVADKGDNTRGAHMLWVVRLDSGKSINDLIRAEQTDETAGWVRHMGGPGFSHPPASTNATMLLEPGSYALVCYVGSGRANTARYHLLHGMIRPLTVVPERTTRATMPTPDVIAKVTGDALTFSKPLRAGRALVMVQNETARRIEFKVVRVPDGMTGKEFMALPGDVEGVTSPGSLASVPPGGWVMTTLDFTSGEHVVGTRPALRHPSSQIIMVGRR
jgi:hypothetical protein